MGLEICNIPIDRTQAVRIQSLFNLTKSEMALLSHLDIESTNAQIGERISKSEHTVKRHLRKIYSKTGVNSRVQLICTLLAYQTPEIHPEYSRAKEHIETLAAFQRYRTGEDQRTFEETGLTPKAISDSINWSIETLSKLYSD
ncbi:helix-turn-helix transcriptional regulator [Vibrio vulnificus]|nr:helix-turn-helix transcriptional regulator [Vibrio vulnificus]